MISDFSIAILTGGSGIRMGGGPHKALIPLRGKPLLSWVVDSLRTLDREMFLVGGDAELFRHFGLPHFPDAIAARSAAVGIHAALEASPTEWCLTVPCDMPFIHPGLAAALAHSAGDELDAVVPMSGSAAQPLFALYRKSCLPAFSSRINNSRMSIMDILSGLRVSWMRKKEIRKICDPEVAFFNVNTAWKLDSAGRLLADRTPLVCFVGKKDSGKTTLLEKLVATFADRGLQAAYVKHDVHGFAMDRPGTDTDRLLKAGALAVAISSPAGDAVLERSPLPGGGESGLAGIRRRFQGPVDIILVEGYKTGTADKIEVSRSGRSDRLACSESDLIAVISDRADAASQVPLFDLDNIEGVAAFLQRRYGLSLDQKSYLKSRTANKFSLERSDP